MNKLFSIKEIEISYNYGTIKAERETVKSRLDAEKIFRSALKNSIEYKESFFVLVLNNDSEILGIKKISEGGITSAIVDVRLVFQTILKAHGTAFIICHNHPSGKLKPSQSDIKTTNKLKQGAKILDLTLLDHLIITKDDVFSFEETEIL